MSRQHGRFAQVYMGIASGTAAASPLPNAGKWMLNFSAKRDDATAFGDSNSVFVQGLPDGSGSFEAIWDLGTAQTYTAACDGVARNSYFYPTTPAVAGPYWYGSYFWDFNVEADVGNAVKVKGTFAPAGPITKISN